MFFFRSILFLFVSYVLFRFVSKPSRFKIKNIKNDGCTHAHTDNAGGKDAESVWRGDDEENVPLQNTLPSRDGAADLDREGESSAAAAAAPGGGGRDDGAIKEWVCSICTFANAFSKRKCSMCMEGVRPPGMGRSQPLSPRPPGEANRISDLQGEEGGKKKVRHSRK